MLAAAIAALTGVSQIEQDFWSQISTLCSVPDAEGFPLANARSSINHALHLDFLVTSQHQILGRPGDELAS